MRHCYFPVVVNMWSKLLNSNKRSRLTIALLKVNKKRVSCTRKYYLLKNSTSIDWLIFSIYDFQHHFYLCISAACCIISVHYIFQYFYLLFCITILMNLIVKLQCILFYSDFHRLRLNTLLNLLDLWKDHRKQNHLRIEEFLNLKYYFQIAFNRYASIILNYLTFKYAF